MAVKILRPGHLVDVRNLKEVFARRGVEGRFLSKREFSLEMDRPGVDNMLLSEWAVHYFSSGSIEV